MAIPFITTTLENPRSPDDYAVTTTGGTIDGASGTLELAYDDAVFTGAAGKDRLIMAVKHLLDTLQESKFTWPAT